MVTAMTLDLLRKVRENIIGYNRLFHGPFGPKRILYCDYTASGKSLECIEKFICDHVHPFYANTHTSTSVSGLMTTTYREESRDIIRRAVNAGPEDAVIFTGSGATAAIHKIISVLDLRPPKTEHTVVIIGPYEHHSNSLPWKETGVSMERVVENADGGVDLADLERHLRHYFHRGFCIIVTMSAASNVTGILSDTDVITRLVHKYGGLACWDFATAAPYLPIDMNPGLDCAKDAVFISPHKFPGGVGSPGILIAKKKLFNNRVPDKCGGGTVTWVTQQRHEYMCNIPDREEGGTPAIVESIRAGLAFQVKSLIGDDVIMQLEEELCQRALLRWRGNPCLQLLGSYTATRLPIFSFVVYQPLMGKYLHHNFISALLNDLYGIQVRGGCACAGPYAQDLLEMSERDAMRFVHSFLSETRKDLGKEVLVVMKPGFVRLNLPYFLDDECVEFILTAVETVAREGWKLLPVYAFDKYTGNWRHRKGVRHTWAQLRNVSFDSAEEASLPAPPKRQLTYNGMLKDARRVFNSYQTLAEESGVEEDDLLMFDAQDQDLMWFLQPQEVYKFIVNPELPEPPVPSLPFRPRRKSSTYKHPPMSFNPSEMQDAAEQSEEDQDQTYNRNVHQETSTSQSSWYTDSMDGKSGASSGLQKEDMTTQCSSSSTITSTHHTVKKQDVCTQINLSETDQDNMGQQEQDHLESSVEETASNDMSCSKTNHNKWRCSTPCGYEEKEGLYMESHSSGDSAFVKSPEHVFQSGSQDDGYDSAFLESQSSGDSVLTTSSEAGEDIDRQQLDINTSVPDTSECQHDRMTQNINLRGVDKYNHQNRDKGNQSRDKCQQTTGLQREAPDLCSSMEQSLNAGNRAFVSLLKIQENYYSPIMTRKFMQTEDSATSPVCSKFPESPVNLSPFSSFDLSEKDYDRKDLSPIKSLIKQHNTETIIKLNNEQANFSGKKTNEENNGSQSSKDDDDHIVEDMSKSISLVSVKTCSEEEQEEGVSSTSGKKSNKKGTKKNRKKRKEMCTVM